MPKFRLNLSSKILVYFLLVSLVPLVLANTLLITTANNELLKAASAKQEAVANNLADSVGGYLTFNVDSLDRLAELYGSEAILNSDVGQNVTTIIAQDPDIKRLAVLDDEGNELYVYDNGEEVSDLRNASGTDAFKAVNFLADTYVGSVKYDESNEPTITIATPVFGSGGVSGAVVGDYNISNLWESVLSTRFGENGYAYVIDGLGNLVAHPDRDFLTSTQKLTDVEAARQFIDGELETRQTTSEKGQQVISTPKNIPGSGLGIVVQEPVASVNASINDYIESATIVGLSAVTIAILVSVFFRRQLIGPIKKLSAGAKLYGLGRFDHKIEVDSQDELQELADTFNSMGANINQLVTKLRDNNQTLANEKAKLTNIFQNASDGIVALDAQGQILSVNPPAARLVGRDPQSLVGANLSDYYEFKNEDRPVTIELDKPGTHQYNDVALRKDDTMAYLNLVLSVISRNESGVAAILTIHDLTKSRELEFMKLDFVAIAAHELRTPLTVVRGYLELLKDGAKKQLTIFNLENLQKVISATGDLGQLINKLLNIARIERGDMEIFIENLNLSKLVEENVNNHTGAATRNEQTLTYTTNAKKPVYVPADPSSITEVLNNLLGNALKFSRAGAEINVSLEVDDDEVIVKVSDNGPGIPESLRAKLFTKFYRAERSLISGTRGTGLGLFISKTIIELQNGSIGLEPDDGNGSTFYFTLPVYKPEKHDKLMSTDKSPGGVRGWFKKDSHS
ncbi:MAG: ATP-binding protein [Candidatus Saccharibacteria bacterium]|nr:ATP-binding protein [Candidatus Saccharibacteria bacterium]